MISPPARAPRLRCTSPPNRRPLKRNQLPTGTVALAKALIGLLLVRETADGITAGRIVEAEAYLGNDPASHSYRGQTKRNASMFADPFHSYVYKIYGTSFCFNVSSEAKGRGEAVLLRALEPVDGLDIMMLRRGTERIRDLCRGPGRLCSAMAIDAGLDGIDLLAGKELWIAQAAPAAGRSARASASVSPRRQTATCDSTRREVSS